MNALLRRRSMIAAGGSPTPPTPTIVYYDMLVFDGTAYIDTGVTAPTDASFLVRLGNETSKVQQRCFLLPTQNSGYIGMLYNAGTTSSNRGFSIYYGKAEAVNTAKTLPFSTKTYNFFLTPSRFGWGSNNSFTFTRGDENASGPLVLGSNISHTGQPFTGTMGELKIYGSDAKNVTNANGFSSYTPVYTLKPCTYNGVAGMYCTETSTFYGNTAGAGTLTVQNNS